jgi:probable addiction module antidote protein
MSKITKSYSEYLSETLQDPEEAAAYINAAIEDGDDSVLLLALRDVIEARGGMGTAAKKARLNRESLYRALRPAGNPKLRSISSLLEAVGLQLGVKPKKTSSKKKTHATKRARPAEPRPATS